MYTKKNIKSIIDPDYEEYLTEDMIPDLVRTANDAEKETDDFQMKLLSYAVGVCRYEEERKWFEVLILSTAYRALKMKVFGTLEDIV